MYKLKKQKFSKYKNTRKLNLSNGNIALKAIESGYLNKFHIDIIKKILKTKIKKFFKIWIKINFIFIVTKKSLNFRMGNGKGKFNHFVAKINVGSIILEVATKINKTFLKNVLTLCKYKIPLKTIIFE